MQNWVWQLAAACPAGVLQQSPGGSCSQPCLLPAPSVLRSKISGSEKTVPTSVEFVVRWPAWLMLCWTAHLHACVHACGRLHGGLRMVKGTNQRCCYALPTLPISLAHQPCPSLSAPAPAIQDIAGLVKGASKGEGLGNQFLANIRECDSIVQVGPSKERKTEYALGVD